MNQVTAAASGRSIVADLFHNEPGARVVSDELVSLVVQDLPRVARQLASATGAIDAQSLLTATYSRLAADLETADEDRLAIHAICAAAMRQIVVAHATGQGHPDDAGTGASAASGLQAAGPSPQRIIDIDEVLHALQRVNTRLVRIVECRYFAKLSPELTARSLRVESETVEREWLQARAWLLKEVGQKPAGAREVSIANATWVDAVLGNALALPEKRRPAFLEKCHAAHAGLSGDVEELLRLATEEPGALEPDEIPADRLWFILTGLESPFSEAAPPVEAGNVEPDATEPPELKKAPDDHQTQPEEHSQQRSHRSGEDTEVRGGAFWSVRIPGIAEKRAAISHAIRSLSSLKHPGFARLLHAGETDDDGLFVVTEAAEGRPIDVFCDEELLTVAQRSELFLEVCRAVAFAHGRFVAHGALDPSNVLVVGDGTVKLLNSGFTNVLKAAGIGSMPPGCGPSRRYRTPDHAGNGPVTVAGDVYQLGLLLGDLLAGAAAGDSEGAEPLPSERAAASPGRIANARRVRRRVLVRKLRGGLDAIVACATDPDPEKRYPTVKDLEEDVVRWLQNRPVRARAGSAAYRLRMFIVRRRVVVALLVIALGLGAWAVAGPLRQRMSERLAEEREGAVRQALESIVARPASSADGSGPSVLRHLESVTALIRKEIAPGRPERARLLATVGQEYASLGEYGPAIDLLAEASAIHSGATAGHRSEQAEVLEALGKVRRESGRFDQAEADLSAAASIWKVEVGATHHHSVRASFELGRLLHDRGRLLEAETAYRTALGDGRTRVSDPDRVGELIAVGKAGLAGVLRDRGSVGEAATYFEDSIAALRRYAGASTRRAEAEAEFARLRVERSQTAEAESVLERVLPELQAAYHPEHPIVASTLGTYAALRLEQQRFGEARQLLDRAMRLQQKRYGRVHPAIARTRSIEAELARQQNQPAAASSLATQALADYEQLGLADHPGAILARLTLADALITLGEREQPLAILGPALTQAERLFVKDDPRTQRIRATMARAARRLIVRVPSVGAPPSVKGSAP